MALTNSQLKELRRAHPNAAGNRLSIAMDLAGLKQADLADAVELTQPYVSDVVRGRYATITLDNARRFAAFFGCSIEDLFPAKSEVA